MRKKWTVAALLVLVATIAVAGTNTLTSVSGGRVQTSHVNQYYTALGQDVVPRNTSGAPTSIGGSLGNSVYKWLKAFVESGYWKAGDIKMHHTFNGAVECGEGWMLADGRVINSTNYDTEHGAGTWTTYVGSSPLSGKFLPNFTGKYPVGVATTTQSGSVAITSVGNAGNTVNLQHNHGSRAHTHFIMTTSPSGAEGVSASGSAQDFFTTGTCSSGNATGIAFTTGGTMKLCSPSIASTSGNWATQSGGVTSPNALSATQSIQPESIQVQYCMRVID